MAVSEHRQISRDSLFVMADVRADGKEGELRVRVRNLSAGGMMAEGQTPALVSRGQIVWVNVRNVGWTEGSVAWVQDQRFGIAFREEIDAMLARAPAEVDPASLPQYLVRRPMGLINTKVDSASLRKI